MIAWVADGCITKSPHYTGGLDYLQGRLQNDNPHKEIEYANKELQTIPNRDQQTTSYDIIIISSYQLSLVTQESWINTRMYYCHEKILCGCKINISPIAINYHTQLHSFHVKVSCH